MGFARRDVKRVTDGLQSFGPRAERYIRAAQDKNAQEAQAWMRALAPKDEGVTLGYTVATSYHNRSQGVIGMVMQTARPNRPTDGPYRLERIKAILFANDRDFFYATWRTGKKRWRGRMRRAMTKSARETAQAMRGGA